MKTIFSEHAPKAIGPYSHAVRVGELLFCSGQTPLEPGSMLVEAMGIEAQTRRVIENVKIVLATEGLTLNHVVKVTVFLSDMNLFQGMNTVYAEVFGAHKPARTTVAVKALPCDALVEIECVASYIQKTFYEQQ